MTLNCVVYCTILLAVLWPKILLLLFERGIWCISNLVLTKHEQVALDKIKEDLKIQESEMRKSDPIKIIQIQLLELEFLIRSTHSLT